MSDSIKCTCFIVKKNGLIYKILLYLPENSCYSDCMHQAEIQEHLNENHIMFNKQGKIVLNDLMPVNDTIFFLLPAKLSATQWRLNRLKK